MEWNKDIEVKEVIICNLLTRGDGKSPYSPYRKVLQVFEKDGTLIAECDTLERNFTVEQMCAFVSHCEYNKALPTHEELNNFLAKWNS